MWLFVAPWALAWGPGIPIAGAASTATSQPAASTQAATQPATDATSDVTPSSEADPVLGGRNLAFHVLNRLAYGPTAAELKRFEDMGWQAWIDEQIQPHTIDDSELDQRLQRQFPSLGMSMTEVFRRYRPPYAGDEPTEDEQRRRRELHQRVQLELRQATVIRAVHSRRQLVEVLVDFWRNHLNVDQNKDDVAFLAAHYEQTVIRRHLLGRYEDMLLASAQHPAMLIYLDNAVSQKPLDPHRERLVQRFEGSRFRPRSVEALARHRGLNENYARELFELHTFGVDRGYTQRDVTEMARLLTGWSVGMRPERPGGPETYGFVFRREVHDYQEKWILGVRIGGSGGLPTGEEAIRGLARHPRTARFLAEKLCTYLVNDDPPEPLVRRAASVYQRTGGSLHAVYGAIITSPEFLDATNYRAKFKTPFEFVASAARAADAQVTDARRMLQWLHRMGQPIHECEDPTGYPERASEWLDPGVLVHRWEFAMALAFGRVSGVTLDEARLERLGRLSSKEMIDAILLNALPGGVDADTRATLDELATRGRTGVEAARLTTALVLGSPSFQQE